MSTFVALGTAKAPFMRLVIAVESLTREGRLPTPVILQCGWTEFSSKLVDVRRFLNMEDFEAAVRGATLIITQAGGGTVLLARSFGKMPVCIPRRKQFDEVVDDHQIENGIAMERNGMCILAMSETNLPEAIDRALHLQQSPTAQLSTVSPLAASIDQQLTRWETLKKRI